MTASDIGNIINAIMNLLPTIVRDVALVGIFLSCAVIAERLKRIVAWCERN